MITAYSSRSFLFLAGFLATAPFAVAQLGVAVLAGTNKSASAALTVSSATAAIQSCAFEARGQLIFDMESRLKEAAGLLHDLSVSAKALPASSQEQFTTALDDLKLQEGVLRMGIESAQKAGEKAWPQVRAALAFSYMDYVGVVSRLELIVYESKTG